MHIVSDEIERLQTLADTREMMLYQLRAQFDDMVKQRDRAADENERLRADNDALRAELERVRRSAGEPHQEVRGVGAKSVRSDETKTSNDEFWNWHNKIGR